MGDFDTGVRDFAPGDTMLLDFIGARKKFNGGGMNARYLRYGLCFLLIVGNSFLLSAQGGMQAPAATLANYQFTVPPGWATQQYPDGIVLSAPPSNINERCLIQVWPMRPASANLYADANSAFIDIFKTYELRNQTSRGGAMPPVVIHGLSGQGWEYLIVKRGIRHPGMAPNRQPWETLLGFVLVAKLNDRVAVISGMSKDSLVSNCFGELGTNVWPRFFYSLSFRNWSPVDATGAMRKQLAGTWTIATATVADQFTFAGNGRYATAAAAQRYAAVSSTELVSITDAYFGNGAYTLRGNAIRLVQDDRKNQPEDGLFRVEQESKDEGRSWAEVMYLLRISNIDGKDYEVRYNKK